MSEMPRSARRDVAPSRTPARRHGARQRPTQVDREWETLQARLAEADELGKIAAELRARHGELAEAARLEQLGQRRIVEVDPIRISHAQRLLGVSNQTVRAWIAEGVLEDFGGSPRRVGLESVMRAREIIEELRQQGRDRELMSVVLSRLEALELKRDPDFRQSLAQMRRGKRLSRPY